MTDQAEIARLRAALSKIANGDAGDETAHDWPEFYESLKRVARAALENITCAFCGGPAEGNYTIHRDGYGEGPEVDLCDAHGRGTEPTLATIWARISTHGDEGMPTMTCPQCGAVHHDFDGFGFLAHIKTAFPDGCGYCKHPTIDNGVCGICGMSEASKEFRERKLK